MLNLPDRKIQGFSLVEVLVSMGVIVVILSVIVSNQSTYADAVALTNLSDEIASTVTQAQAYGNAVKELTPGSIDFTASYGLAFSLQNNDPTAYIFFADRNGDQIYSGDWNCVTGGAAECLAKTAILRNNVVDSICIIRSSGGDQCNTIQRVDISFVRPHLEAQIRFFNNGGQEINMGNTLGAKIILRSPSGLTRSVSVYESGQVSAQ